MTQPLPTISFSKLQAGMPMPHLLDIQTRSFDAFLRPVEESEHADMSLERVFQEVFPIADVNGNYSLEFVKYSLGDPKYSVEECIERDMTYSASLKATLRLIINETLEGGGQRPKNIIESPSCTGHPVWCSRRPSTLMDSG
jgi:DNA-directed RNA polymerase subunit beta